MRGQESKRKDVQEVEHEHLYSWGSGQSRVISSGGKRHKQHVLDRTHGVELICLIHTELWLTKEVVVSILLTFLWFQIPFFLFRYTKIPLQPPSKDGFFPWLLPQVFQVQGLKIYLEICAGMWNFYRSNNRLHLHLGGRNVGYGANSKRINQGIDW